MARPVIQVTHLGKRYELRHKAESVRYQRFSESLAHWARAPLRIFRPSTLNSQLSTRREEFWALNEVSFEIGEGEVVGIIGRNGAGKSTLLKILSRITEPTTGKVTLRGRVASLLEVGTGFHPELTGRENVFLNGAILGMTKLEIRARFDEIVAFAEVERFLDTPVKHYSSGMHVRLAFSVAAHLHAEILLMDEVLAVGDTAFQAKCLQKLDAVAAEHGKSVILVSHNMDAILRLASRALLIEDGRLAYAGSSREAVERYSQASMSTPRETDLACLPRPGHIRGGVHLLKASTPRMQSLAVPFGDDLELCLDMEVHCSLEFAELGIGLFSASGTEIASMLSSHSLPPAPLQPGRFRFTARYRSLQIMPGSYFLGIGIRSDRGLEDYLPRSVHFTVVPNDKSARFHTDTFRGFIVPETQCDMVSLSA